MRHAQLVRSITETESEAALVDIAPDDTIARCAWLRRNFSGGVPLSKTAQPWNWIDMDGEARDTEKAALHQSYLSPAGAFARKLTKLGSSALTRDYTADFGFDGTSTHV